MPLVDWSTEGAVTVLTLRNPPANALRRALLRELAGALDRVEAEKPRALVLSGGGGKFFSAGLDLMELPDLSRSDVEALGTELVGALLRLFRLPCPVLAAVNGHAVAGGALLALTAERRVGVCGGALFGLNEVQVGLPLPAPLFELVRSEVDEAHAGRVLLEGHNHTVDEALAAGLLHEAVSPGELMDRTLTLARKLASVPQSAYARMKELLRSSAEERIGRQGQDADFVRIWFEPETQATMRAARDRLKGRSTG